MKRSWAALWILALVAAFALGRFGSGGVGSGPSSVTSFREVMDEDDPVARAFGITSFLRGLSAENVEEVAEVIEAEKNWASDPVLLLFMTAWTHFDELAAIDWAFSRKGHFRGRASAAVIESLALRNPSSALSAIDAFDEPSALDSLHNHMVSGWARSDFKAELTRYIMEIPRDMDRQRATQILSLEILKDGIEASIEWADGISDDATRNFKVTAVRRVASDVAGIDPQRAVAWIEGQPDQPHAEIARSAIAERWLESDPAAAMDWMLTFPMHPKRSENIGSSFSTWLDQDPDAATAWLRSVSPAAAVDSAIVAVVRRDSKRQPDSALDWAHLIHDEGLRRSALLGVGRRWLEQDPDAFKAWLPKSGLQGDIRREIMTPTPRR
jgi:hypothetical protein